MDCLKHAESIVQLVFKGSGQMFWLNIDKVNTFCLVPQVGIDYFQYLTKRTVFTDLKQQELSVA